jgi:hypothetical protein
VRGIIKFDNNQPAAYVTVKIGSREPYFKTNENGEFYRILLPGTYQLSILYNCQEVYTTNFSVSKLLEFNITLTSNLFDIYNTYKTNNSLNKYAAFCSPNKKPAACSNSYSTSPIMTTKPTTKPTTRTTTRTTTKTTTKTTTRKTTTTPKKLTTTRKTTTTPKKLTTARKTTTTPKKLTTTRKTTTTPKKLTTSKQTTKIAVGK